MATPFGNQIRALTPFLTKRGYLPYSAVPHDENREPDPTVEASTPTLMNRQVKAKPMVNAFKSVSGPTWAGGTPTNAIADITSGQQVAPGQRRTRYMTGAMTSRGLTGGSGMGVSSNTGGPGASAALPGRIGYRGTLGYQDNENGINWLKRGRDEADQNAGARREIDPITGLSRNPTDDEIRAQLHMLRGKGDEPGLEGRGVGGTVQANALASYYDALRGNDPNAITTSGNAVRSLKRTIDSLRGSNDAVQPSMPGQSVPPPYGQVGADEEEGLRDTMGLATGGKEKDWHPYIVNEEGMESVQYDGDKKPTLIPGGEHMTLFPRPGKVIPHGRTMQMLKENKVAMPEHRAKGGGILGSRSRAGSFTRGFLGGLKGLTGLQGLQNLRDYLFNEEPETPQASLADLRREPYYYSSDETGLPNGNFIPGPRSPTVDDIVGKIAPPPVLTTPPITVSGGGTITPQALGNPIVEPVSTPLPVVDASQQALNTATQAMMGNRGVNTLPARPATRSFITPYGTASVSYGAPTAGPHIFNADGTPWVPSTGSPTVPQPTQSQYLEQKAQDRIYPDRTAAQLARVASNQALVDQANEDDMKALGRSLAPARKMGGKVSRTRMMAAYK